MISMDHIAQFREEGACIVPGGIDPHRIQLLKAELAAAVEEDLQQRPDVFDTGMVHNCMLRGREMARLLDDPLVNSYTKVFLSESFILYAYQSSSLPPGESNYGSRIHVDCPRFTGGYVTNTGVMFPLDDFTLDNGATYYLKGSHKWSNEDQLSEKEFYSQADRLVCTAGDLIFLDARLLHAAGTNYTNEYRHALTMNFCRCFMRQRFDFCRMVPTGFFDSLGPDGRRLMGWDVRVPTNLEEFYLPPEERLYKPGQE